jgi:hypothetical protein
MKLFQNFNREKVVWALAISYITFGIVFAFVFALYYRWTPLSYFSPGFYNVVFTWPFQAGGLIKDLLYYGLSGKP